MFGVCVQLRLALEELREENSSAAEKLHQQEKASHAQLQALQSALSAAQVTSPFIKQMVFRASWPYLQPQ